jgi:hypothetical protein
MPEPVAGKRCVRASRKNLRGDVRMHFGYSCSCLVFVKRARSRITSTIVLIFLSGALTPEVRSS